MTQETVTINESIASVVLIPSSGQLIFSTERVIVLPNGDDFPLDSKTETATIDLKSDLYGMIMAQKANVVID